MSTILQHIFKIYRINGMSASFLKRFTVVCVFSLSFFYSHSQSPSSEEDLKKQASKLFEDDEFTQAYKLYAQLVSNYPKDPEYNYRLGVCMLFSEPDKKKCYSYLEFATNYPKDAPKDAKFYLAKAYHINYKFDEAIKLYNQYKLIGSSSQIKKLQVDREINACQNGKRLLATMQELIVMNKKQLNESDYFRSYDLSSVGGKLLVKPDVFKTAVDKKKKDNSVIFLPKASDKVYFSSYGADGKTGRDIYYAQRLPNGDFGKPIIIAGINTEFDEDYPFLHPNGKTLYFSSKGHNSMGGYDVFKSTFNESSQTWGNPVNMEFPINSPDDDYLFVTDSTEKIAYFSTGRQSPPGKIDVLKINTERAPMEIAVIKGTVVKEEASQSLSSKITIKNLEDGKIVGTFNAQENGDYNLELPNGGKFIFTVETPGIPTQSDKVVLPMATTLKPYKQSISYDLKVLKIINYFDTPPDDEGYLKYLDLIEKKAKLDVNEGQIKVPTVVDAVATNTPAVKTNNPTVTESDPVVNTNTNTNANANTTNTVTSKEGLTNTQLVDIAKTDAKEAKVEADKMKQDEWDATEIGTAKKIEADNLQKEADDAFTSANAITDEVQKKEALEKATAIKDNANNATKVAEAIINLAKNLGDDARAKEKEVALNDEYAKQLEAVIKNKNNKEALAKLDDLQKQIEDLSKQKKQSDVAYNAIKTDLEQKQNQVVIAEDKSNKLKNNIEEIKKEISNNETELAKTKDKNLKQSLTAQVSEQKIELDTKTKELAQNEITVKNLKDEASSLQNEIDLANKIKTTDSANPIATANTNTNPTNTNPNNKTEPISYTKVATKYNGQIESATNTDKPGIEELNKILTNYNKEVKDLIALDKLDLNKAKTPAEKKKITDELKKLEQQQQINDTKIATNNAKIKELDNTNTVATNNTNTTTVTENNPKNNTEANNTQPISVKFDGTDDVNKLTELKNNINTSNNPAFDYKDYKEPSSQSLKTDAEFKLQTANTTKAELTASIEKAQEDLKNNPPVNTKAEAEQLNSAALNYSKKATNIRIEAESYQGTDKENMLNDAKLLQNQSNKKHLESSELTKTGNKKQKEINEDNITNLLATNKSKGNEVSEANKLNEEAKLNFKQAADIREEANSQGSDAAKVGMLSNAEEKENDALAKQKQAVDLLMKANGRFNLKTLDNANNPALTKVSDQYTQLNKEKMDAYMSLSKANQNEIKLQEAKLNQNPAIKKNTNAKAVGFKKEADALNKEAIALVGKALAEPDPAQKQNLLLEANKKEIAAITAINNANLELEGKPVVVNENPVATNTVTETNPVNTNTVVAENNPVVNTNTVVAETNPVVNTNTNSTKNTNPVVTNTVAVNTNPTKDTTVKNVPVNNTEAVALKTTAENNLKTLSEEQKKLEEEIKATSTGTISETEAKSNVAVLTKAADSLNKKAVNIRIEAESYQGADKENMQKEAKDLETTANTDKLKAADVQKKLNDAQYDVNKETLDVLLEKAKSQNATELSQAQELIDLANTSKKQATTLRDETNGLPDAAKLGGVSNAEEKESDMLMKQMQVISLLRKYSPDYVAKEVSLGSSNANDNATPEQKAKLNELNQKQATELANLNKAFVMEYDATNSKLPANLNQQQKLNKVNAANLMKEATVLNDKANQTSDLNLKKDLLKQAGEKEQSAIVSLNKVGTTTAVVANNNPRNNNVVANNNPRNNNVNNNPRNNNVVANNPPRNNDVVANNPPRNNNTATIKVQGLEVKNNNAYSAANPIPVDAKVQDGLIFRVQIGAFRAPLPSGTFKGLSPVNAQTTPTGWIRYTAGNFEAFEIANAVKNDLRNLGYKDAFVVGYYNGQRITVSEAVAILQKEGKPVDLTSNNTAGINANTNVPRNTVVVNAVDNTNPTEQVTVTNELEKLNGLLYTIQIGVYTKLITKTQLYNLQPIYTEKLPSGLYRYTAGIYNQGEKLLNDKGRVVNLGIKDAFVSAYFNSKRVPFAEGQKIQADSSTKVKMEPENPIVFPSGQVTNTPIDNNVTAPVTNNNNPAPANNNTNAPFSNGVTNGPTPTAENGVKTDEAGVTYKVQIGAYTNRVPKAVADRFLNIKTWPIVAQQNNGLYIYSIGSFSDIKFAKTLQAEAKALGINDAFVTVYTDGKRTR